MTKKHRIYFFFYKIWCYVNFIFPGRFVYTYSQEKEKFIKGVVTSFEGESVTRDNFGFDIGINWLEPIQGFDTRYYTWGGYSLKSFFQKIRLKPISVTDLRIGEKVLRRKSSDENPQWRETTINKTYLELIKEFPQDYKIIY